MKARPPWQIAEQQVGDHRHHQRLAQAANDLPRHAGDKGKALRLGMRRHGGGRVGGKAHIGVEKQQMRAARSLGQMVAGMHLPVHPGGSGGQASRRMRASRAA